MAVGDRVAGLLEGGYQRDGLDRVELGQDLKIGGVYVNNEATRVFLGRVRNGGKLKFAWLEIGYGGIKKDRWQSHAEMRLSPTQKVGAWNNKEVVPRTVAFQVTGAHNYAKMEGRVTLPEDHRDRVTEWQNTYGWKPDDLKVEWA